MYIVYPSMSPSFSEVLRLFLRISRIRITCFAAAPIGVRDNYTQNKLPNAGSVDTLLSRVDNPTVSEWYFDADMNTLWIKMGPDVFDVMPLDDF